MFALVCHLLLGPLLQDWDCLSLLSAAITGVCTTEKNRRQLEAQMHSQLSAIRTCRKDPGTSLVTALLVTSWLPATLDLDQ